MSVIEDQPTAVMNVGLRATGHDLGGKARALAALDRAGFPVPAWFVITPDAYGESVTAGFGPSPELRAEIDRALAWFCPDGEPVAVRSSAVDEDKTVSISLYKQRGAGPGPA